MKNILKLSLCLFIICTLVTVMLAISNEVTAPIIEERKASDQIAARKEVVPEATDFEEIEIGDNPSVKGLMAAKNGDKIVGYAIEVEENGYSGTIDMIIGVLPNGTVTGIKYIDMSETPGLGEKIKKPNFYNQFLNKEVNSFIVKKSNPVDEDEILAVSGATISSAAVTRAVNEAISIILKRGDSVK